jgi:hypothetical protein
VNDSISPIRASPLENLDEFLEIPQLLFAASLEPLLHPLSKFSIGLKN